MRLLKSKLPLLKTNQKDILNTDYSSPGEVPATVHYSTVCEYEPLKIN